ncbi:threonine synthase [Lysobacteraceae bacterium NML03-0222]|nr:threonine synthase [Xanthomonadaceae bacterium NML03-0222]
MRYASTRGQSPVTDIDLALEAGLAPDGGLYVPMHIPQLAKAAPWPDLASAATAILSPFFTASRLCERLPQLCTEAFNFASPLRHMHGERDFLLELFHGPTAAFKDYAARFLAASLAALRDNTAPTRTIMVATSGDTGAAVAAAFHRRAGFRVVILYPQGRVSPRQAHGLECWGENIHTLRIAGSFDDCQRLAKTALSDSELRARLPLGSANSISLGRLLPQIAYYGHNACTFFAEHGQRLNFIIPTGNLGNASAAFLARQMGLPVGDIHLACNANDTLPRFFQGQDYAAQTTRATLANAMDVGAPSNFERLRYWHDSDAELRSAISASSSDDATIRAEIAAAHTHHGITPCPHTACGLAALHTLRKAGDHRPWAVVATAHPAKFESIVEPLTGQTIPLPAALAKSLARPAQGEPLANDYSALRQWLLALPSQG